MLYAIFTASSLPLGVTGSWTQKFSHIILNKKNVEQILFVQVLYKSGEGTEGGKGEKAREPWSAGTVKSIEEKRLV